MQPPRNFIRVLIEFPASMQNAHNDLSSRTLWLMFIIELDTGWDATPVVDDRNGIVCMNGNQDIVTVPG